MRQRRYYKRRKGKKRGRGIPYIYKSKIYLGKNLKQVVEGFSSHRTSLRKRWRRYWTLKFKKKFRRKSNKKN